MCQHWLERVLRPRAIALLFCEPIEPSFETSRKQTLAPVDDEYPLVRPPPLEGTHSGHILMTTRSFRLSKSAFSAAASSRFVLAAGIATLFAASSVANAVLISWDPAQNDSASGGAGTWDNSTPNWLSGTSDIAWVSTDTAVFGGATGGTVTLGAAITAGGLNFNTTGYTITGNTLTLGGTTPMVTTASGVTATINSAIGGTAGLTKAGNGTLILQGADNYTGATTISGGTLTLDYSVNNTAKLDANSALTLGTATLNLSGGSYAESVTGTTLAGAAQITRSSGTATINLGSITLNLGGSLDVATAGIAQTSNSNDATGILGAWATVGGKDWAANDGSNNIVAYSGYTNDTWAVGNNTTVTTSGTIAAGSTTNSLRFNAATAATLTLSATNTITSGGILVTSTVGNNATAITGGTLSGSATNGLIVLQNDTANTLTISSVIANNGTTGTPLTKAGAGTLILNGADTFTGMTTITGGTLQLNNASALKSANSITLGASGSANPTLLVNASGMSLGALTVPANVTGAAISFTQNSATWSETINGATIGSPLTINQSNTTGTNWNQISWSSKITGGVAPGQDALIFNNTSSTQNYFTTGTGVVNDFTGNIHVKSGLIAVQGGSPSTNQVVPDAAMVIVDSGATWRWNGATFTETVDGIAGAGTFTNNAGSAVLTINANNSANQGNRVFSGSLGGLSGTLTFSGTGTQEFSGANLNFTAPTALNNGTLKLTNTTAWASNIAVGTSNSPTLQLNSNSGTWGFSKQITGGSAAAKIEKIGPGTVTLSPAASSSFVGNSTAALTVTAGSLYLNSNGFTTAPAVSIASGAFFGGTATAGAITVNNGATLQGGYSGAGTLTAGNVTVNNGGIIDVSAGGLLSAATVTLGATSSDTVTIAGSLAAGKTPVAVTNLTINGGNQSVILNASGLGLTSGSYYDLIDSTNAITAPNDTSVLATLKSNSRAYTPFVDATGTKIQLFYDANASIYWTGAASSAWDTSSTNWNLSGNNAGTQFMANDVVFFHDNPTSSTVNISGGNVTPISVTFDATGTTYTLQGSNGISTGTITKTGAGTLIISNVNTTNGAVALNGGSVNMAQGGGLGTGTVTFGGGSLNYTGTGATDTWSQNLVMSTGATIGVANAATTLTAGGSISGSGNFTKTGAGTLALSGANTSFGGTVTVAAGTLAVNTTSGLPSTVAVTLGNNGSTGATLSYPNGDGTIASLSTAAGSSGDVLSTSAGSANHTVLISGAVTLNAPLSLTQASGGWCSMTLNGITGSGVAAGNDALLFHNGSGSNFYITSNGGTYNYTGNAHFMDNGRGYALQNFSGGTAGGMFASTTSVTIDSGVTVKLNNSGTYATTYTFDALNGGGAWDNGNFVGQPMTLSMGNNNGSGSFSGTISNSASTTAIIKNGTGTQTLSGTSNSYSGTTTVNAGTLIVSGKLTSTTQLLVNGGTFQFNATNNVNSSATLSLGGGTLNLNGTSQTLGTMNLTSGLSTIDFGANNTGSTLTLADSTGQTWAGGATLSITDWNSNDHLLFSNTAGGLSPTQQIPDITFVSPAGFGGTNYGAQLVANGAYVEVLPVPEPGTLASLIGGFGMLAGLQRFRRSRRL